MEIIIQKDDEFSPRLQQFLDNNEPIADWSLFQLNYELKEKMLIKDFTALHALTYLNKVTFLDYQINTAMKVIHQMNGTAILADEVGLGKTIEAGLILKELMVRGKVEKVLILAPASLVSQWIEELREKFYIDAVRYRKNYDWDSYPIFVTSIDLAKRQNHRDKILENHYDLIIVDEAHSLKNNQTQNYQFVQAIKKKYCLLLTATPIRNNLKELYNLISIVKPSLLSQLNITKFEKKSIEKYEDKIKYLLHKVMIRNRRQDTKLDHIERHVHHIWLDFTDEELKVYQEIEEWLEKEENHLSRYIFLKELCSSREACYLSLQQSKDSSKEINRQNLMDKIAILPHHVKAKKLVEMIEKMNGEKFIVFTEYRATQFYLQWYLHQHNITSVVFKGSMRHQQKEWARQQFKGVAQVFIATEAGGEGINLQFANRLINYDLPWNPMRVEQRIGRIHRFGQKDNVHIYHFAIKNTIEEHIVKLLYEKIHLFERMVGKLDKILEVLNIDNLDNELSQLIQNSKSEGEMKVKLNHLISVMGDINHEPAR